MDDKDIAARLAAITDDKWRRVPAVLRRQIWSMLEQYVSGGSCSNCGHAAAHAGGTLCNDCLTLQRVSKYVGRHVRDLPGNKSAAIHRPGYWCIWVWEPHRNSWARWYEPRMVYSHQRSWPLRQTATRHYRTCLQNQRAGERYALIDGAGVVQAYAEKDVEQ